MDTNKVINHFLIWGVWLVIPVIIDILGSVVGGIAVFIKRVRRKEIDIDYLPYLTVMIPVYNSEQTLEACLKSILNQNYPIKKIQILLIDNGSTDLSYNIYCKFQKENPQIRTWWLSSKNGKSKALNKGLYNADGKYIINIDSDGVLDRQALINIVNKFETNQKIIAVTGVVLTDIKLIENTKNMFLKLLQRCELFEYTEAFLVGRGYQSIRNQMFTMAGAFSAFRKDIVLKTQLYNAETLGEDTHMTSQIRMFYNGRVELCDDAFFFTEPIENLDRLYMQRQRWQRGQIEVSKLYKDTVNKKRFFNEPLLVNLLIDHTLVFSRMIWMFAMFYLMTSGYPVDLIVIVNLIMYFIYVINSLISFIVTSGYLRTHKTTLKYMIKHIYVILLMPIYRTIVFFIRIAGIINAIEHHNSWNTKTLSQEKLMIINILKGKLSFYFKLRRWINNE